MRQKVLQNSFGIAKAGAAGRAVLFGVCLIFSMAATAEYYGDRGYGYGKRGHYPDPQAYNDRAYGAYKYPRGRPIPGDGLNRHNRIGDGLNYGNRRDYRRDYPSFRRSRPNSRYDAPRTYSDNSGAHRSRRNNQADRSVQQRDERRHADRYDSGDRRNYVPRGGYGYQQPRGGYGYGYQQPRQAYGYGYGNQRQPRRYGYDGHQNQNRGYNRRDRSRYQSNAGPRIR
ncbi:MAG: hypothetical protein AAF387_17035 [Pseudomonadota bacterium]